MCGFSINARDPFRLPEEEHEQRIGPFYNFDPKRLVDQDNDGFYEYLPPDSKMPYVYFAQTTTARFLNRARQAVAWPLRITIRIQRGNCPKAFK